MSGERLITITEAEDGQRLDRWLKKHMPFALAQKLLRKGAVRVDGQKMKGDARLAAGQEVRLPPMAEKAPADKVSYRLTDDDVAFMASLVLYDDGDVLALNKPAGLATQGGSGEKRHIDGMLPALAGKDGTVPRLVHRLDKDTSGVLLLARSAAAVRALGASFKGREIRKIYWAVTAGVPDPQDGTIRAPIGKVKGPHKDKMMIDVDDGKMAVSDYIVLDKMSKEAAFVAFWPRTGRTHQIRVHAAAVLECPVLGDARYGGHSETLADTDIAGRLHLHARRVVLPHPTQPERVIDVTAPLPEDLRQSWQALGFDPSLKDDPFELPA